MRRRRVADLLLTPRIRARQSVLGGGQGQPSAARALAGSAPAGRRLPLAGRAGTVALMLAAVIFENVVGYLDSPARYADLWHLDQACQAGSRRRKTIKGLLAGCWDLPARMPARGAPLACGAPTTPSWLLRPTTARTVPGGTSWPASFLSTTAPFSVHAALRCAGTAPVPWPALTAAGSRSCLVVLRCPGETPPNGR
jgi:hypothetical protein